MGSIGSKGGLGKKRGDKEVGILKVAKGIGKGNFFLQRIGFMVHYLGIGNNWGHLGFSGSL